MLSARPATGGSSDQGTEPLLAPEERAQSYRSELAGRRADTRKVRPYATPRAFFIDGPLRNLLSAQALPLSYGTFPCTTHADAVSDRGPSAAPEQ